MLSSSSESRYGGATGEETELRVREKVITGEFWLGLSKINRLTKEQSNTLRVDLGDFINKKAYAQYSAFSVGDSTTEYTLTVGG